MSYPYVIVAFAALTAAGAVFGPAGPVTLVLLTAAAVALAPAPEPTIVVTECDCADCDADRLMTL